MKPILKYFLYFLGILVIVLIALVITLRVKSPGKADPIKDLNGETIAGSISTIEKIELGGQEQYLIIRGKDATKPVMLFLHGGPGSPEYAFIKATNQAIENDFVMVYWEQRGAGKSYSKNIPSESMNLGQFISDTRELSEYLTKRFNKEKIYLMGHSWGSFLGILTAYQHPELYYAYFGIGQVCHQYKGEYISYEWVKKQATEKNNKKALQALNEITFPDSLASIDNWQDFLMVERNYVSQFGGGVTHEMTGMWPVVKMVLDLKEYTFKEKMNFMPGSLFSLKHLWPEVINKNLFNEIDSMQVPVYIFQGKLDYQTPYSVAKDFFDQLKAPEKEFFTFENSAHSPLMEEVEKFNSIIIKKTAKE
jgi:pimeloyl-ACP methyl ester carboxylesterase